VVSDVRVDKARTLKRIRPEAMGRAHLIRKRSNHVTLHLEDMNQAKHNQKVGKETQKTEETTNDTQK
jgi:large subunit ribosomal protein L22